ncbi:MAG: aspartate carbamoyltransferase regulatory subunit [Candidatus Bathyarchaeota archaeon]|nr:MAG: aspartate carbamoyltransferase regulatory subunit [Candidatus Bathyarchaeota archaeon]
MTETTLRVSKIKDGTVIDHINNGHALDVVRILGINGQTNGTVLIALHVPSEQLGLKDIVKVEGRELKPEEVDKIALLAPQASINIIRQYAVVDKKRVKLPSIISGTVTCGNPACVSNSSEPIQPKFYVKTEDPLVVRCHYCSHIMERQEILRQF